MAENLEDIAVRFAAINGLRWTEITEEAKERYRWLVQDELERRKCKAERPYMPMRMPQLKI